MKIINKQQSLEEYLAERKKRVDEYAARGEDTPEKLEWLRNGIVKRKKELGWIL